MQQDPTIPQPSGNEYRQPSADSLGTKEPETSSRDTIKSVISTIVIILAAPLVALFLTAFVFQSYEVDGPSMEQTLQHGDRLIVLKTGKTWANLTGGAFIPKRGDIIVFSMDERTGDDRQLIKRVIGLPGERIIVRDGTITIYNKEHPDGFNPDEGTEYKNNLPSTTPGNYDYTIREGEVFVCGDNRTNSLDSREFGTVSSEDIIGSLALRIYPFSKLEGF